MVTATGAAAETANQEQDEWHSANPSLEYMRWLFLIDVARSSWYHTSAWGFLSTIPSGRYPLACPLVQSKLKLICEILRALFQPMVLGSSGDIRHTCD
jgi:hypothetical protein